LSASLTGFIVSIQSQCAFFAAIRPYKKLLHFPLGKDYTKESKN